MIGDLVALQSAPPSKWYLSWLRDIRTAKSDLEYLLESIDDGSLGWWSNIGLTVYNRKIVNEFPKWKWEDRQFDLNKRWFKVCKRNNAFEVKPRFPVFNPDGSVMLNVYERWYASNYANPKVFPNWKKLTIKEMDSYYKESVEKFNTFKKEQEDAKRSALSS